MTVTARSLDGTPVPFQRAGRGDPIVLLGADPALVGALETSFTVLSATIPDERMGPSGVEDLAALVHAAGGTAYGYGHGPHAALLMEAAAWGVPFARVVAHAPSRTPDRVPVPTLLLVHEAVESSAIVHVLGHDEPVAPLVEEFLG